MSGDFPTLSEIGEENVLRYLARKKRIAAEKYYDDSTKENPHEQHRRF